MVSRRLVVCICFAATLLVACVSVRGQETTGTIAGTITDSAGAFVHGATAIITNTDKGVVVRTVTSDADGNYVAPLLPIGRYSVTAELAGFKKASQTNIELNVNDKLTVNLTLVVGDVSEVVTVEASPVQVELQTPAAAGLISGTEVTEIALNSRNYQQLVSLMPGVSSDAAGDQIFIGVSNPLSGQSNTVRFSINGTRNTTNNWTVDGADNVDRGSNLTLLNYPSVDAIAEFKVLRGLYSAEFGRTSSGHINVITKSGAHAFHGDAYEFFRNDVLAANNFFNNARRIPRPPLRYNDFGYTFGGPIFIPGHYNTDKSKTFFFWSQEFRRVITYTTVQAMVPTAAEKAGIFPAPVCVAFSGANCTQTASQIPVAGFSPLATAYIKDVWSKIPEGDPVSHTLFTPLRNIFNHRQELIRVDHIFGPKLSVSGRYIHDSIPTEEPRGLFTGAVLPGVSTTSTNSPGRGWVFRGASTLSPTWLNEVGYAYSYGAIVSSPTGLDASANSPDIKPALPFPVTLGRIPTLNAGFSSITGFGPYNDFNRNHNIFDNATKLLGRHTIKFGVSINLYQKTENAGGNNVGSFSFSTTPRPTGTATFLQQWAYFLLGSVSTFTQSSLDVTPDIHGRQFETYVQDDFRVRPNLTFNVGVRWSLFRQPYDDKGMLTNFDPSRWDPAKAPQVDPVSGNIIAGTGDPLNGIIINGQNSPFGSKVANESNKNFAPRFGFAWDPWRDGKTSIRGGYGLAFDTTAYGFFEDNIFNNPPFVQSITISNTRLDNPSSGTTVVSLAPRTIRGTPIENQIPYVQQWSLDVQREITKSFLLDVGYYGSKGTHLLGRVDLNSVPPGAAVAAGIVPPGTFFTSTNTPRLNFIRPFRGYNAVNVLRNWFNSNYHSLQVSAITRFSANSSVRLSYTWSKILTNAGLDTSAPQNLYDRRAEYGLGPFDRRHILTINYVYQLPWMRDQKGFAGHILGGWEVSGITTVNSGLALTVTSSNGFDPAGLGILGASFSGPRPDRVSDPNQNAPHTLTQWFNPSAFAEVPTGVNRPGNSGRGVVTGPGFSRWDFSLLRNIKVREGMRFQFRAEVFNIFNHTNFATVGTAFAAGSTTFGTVTATRDARVAQLALKFYF